MSCVEFKAFYIFRDVIAWRARQWQKFYSDSLIVGGCGARVAQRPRVRLRARYGARALCNWGKLFGGHTCASAECRVSSGAAEFGDVAGAAARGLVWTRRWRGAVSGVVCQIRIVGSVHIPLVTCIKTLRTPNKTGLWPEVNGWWELAQSGT